MGVQDQFFPGVGLLFPIGKKGGLAILFSVTAFVSSAYAFGLPRRSKSSILARTASSTPTPWALEMAIRMATAFKKRLISRGLPIIPEAVVISGASRSAVSNWPISSLSNCRAAFE